MSHRLDRPKQQWFLPSHIVYNQLLVVVIEYEYKLLVSAHHIKVEPFVIHREKAAFHFMA